MTNLQDLRERVAGATGADREIDRALFDLLAGGLFWPDRSELWEDFGVFRAPKPFTASVDAALALIERCLDIHCITLDSFPQSDHASGHKACAQIRLMGGGGSGRVTAPTPALALISALLAAVEPNPPNAPSNQES